MSIDSKIINRLKQLSDMDKAKLLQLADDLIRDKGSPPFKDVLDIEDIREIIIPYCRKYPVKRISLFGSYARGEAKEDSDVDLLIEFETPISLMKILGMQTRLEEELGRKVDLVEPNGIMVDVWNDVEKDLVILYGEPRLPAYNSYS